MKILENSTNFIVRLGDTLQISHSMEVEYWGASLHSSNVPHHFQCDLQSETGYHSDCYSQQLVLYAMEFKCQVSLERNSRAQSTLLL